MELSPQLILFIYPPADIYSPICLKKKKKIEIDALQSTTNRLASDLRNAEVVIEEKKVADE